MPADDTMPAVSDRHGSARLPYPCSERPTIARGPQFIDYGYCRNSLDDLSGSTDPRCPQDCQHKAPESVVRRFAKLFGWRGASAAAEWARGVRNG